MALLRVSDMTHYFGGLRAVYQYNLTIEPGQVYGLIGPNGAGKTTIFNLITGVYTPTEGSVQLDGEEITGRRPHDIAARGLGRTFQDLKLWRHMTVLEHVKMARYAKISYGLIGAFFGTAKRYREEAEGERRARELLAMMRIEQFADSLIVNLPYGAQRRVEMARALATEPKILFLDEPTVADAGHHPAGQPGAGAGDLSHRAPPENGHGALPADPDPGFRRSDRGGQPRRDSERPQGDRSLPWQRYGGGHMMLTIENLQVSYDKIRALHGIDFTLDEGEIICIIGANGAGKSTTLRAISRMVPALPGSKMQFQDKDLLKYPPEKVVSRLGISHVPEGRRLFGNLTVMENLRLATFARKDKEQIEADIKRLFAIFSRLEERAWQKAGTLSGGEQQMLAIIRQVNQELGLAIFLIEHRLKMVMELCQRIQTLVFG
ncbi:MAG: ATP-binding cassette domain-containing protein, partial [Desulfosarcinaceae bacterium]